jgi:hypothetical protein
MHVYMVLLQVPQLLAAAATADGLAPPPPCLKSTNLSADYLSTN